MGLFLISCDTALHTGKEFVKESTPRFIITTSAFALFNRLKNLAVEEGKGVKYSLYHINVAFLRQYLEMIAIFRSKLDGHIKVALIYSIDKGSGLIRFDRYQTKTLSEILKALKGSKLDRFINFKQPR